MLLKVGVAVMVKAGSDTQPTHTDGPLGRTLRSLAFPLLSTVSIISP